MRLSLPLVLLAVLILVSSMASADTIVGTQHTFNCFPFGNCYHGEYQQIYSSAAFTADVRITSVSFLGRPAGAAFAEVLNLSVSLSTTSATLGSDGSSVSTNYSANIGADNTQVFNGYLPVAASTEFYLTIPFTTAFIYKPSAGNLLMDVFINSQPAEALGVAFFAADRPPRGYPEFWTTWELMGRVYTAQTEEGGTYIDRTSLVTQFGTKLLPPPADIPEPSTILLLGTGIVGLIGYGWKRRKAQRCS